MKGEIEAPPRRPGRRSGRLHALSCRTCLLPLVLSLGLLGAVAPATPAAPQGAAVARLSPDDAEAVARAEAALEEVRTLKASFTQVAPDGSLSQGTLYLQRPGRVRFEYAAPSPTLVVADGTWLVLVDRELEQINRFPVYETPIGVLLGREIDLDRRVEVTRVVRGNGLLQIGVVDRERAEEGELTLVFEEPHLLLREWRVRDAQGGITTVSLADHDFQAKLTPDLFVATDGALQRLFRGR